METITSQFELRLAADPTVRGLQGIAVPYDRISHKAGPRPEMFKRGAFASALAAANRVRLRDENHAAGRRPVGVAQLLEDRDAGLYSEWRFYDTPEGRAAYENAREETYGGLSIGFVAVTEHDEGGVRVITEARLHHVALVDEPAYDDARILAVRSADDLLRLRPAPAPDLSDLFEDDDTPRAIRIQKMFRNVHT